MNTNWTFRGFWIWILCNPEIADRETSSPGIHMRSPSGNGSWRLTIFVKICIAILAIASLGTLSGCQHFYRFGNANLRAVGAQALVVPPPPNSLVGTVSVAAPDATLGNLATAIQKAISSSTDFRAAGISAKVSSSAPYTITLKYATTMNLVWTGTSTDATGSEILKFASSKTGASTLSLSGIVAANDMITVTANTISNLKDSIAAVVNQSQQSCANFLGGLVLAETTSNTSFDILSTITSALATAFTPISTVHALTAGTTILTGSKTAVDADIYAKASIANFATAVESTYYTDMSKYVAGLSTADATSLVWQIEMYKISVIHAECALAPAEATIAATLQSTQGPSTQPTTLTASVTAADKTLSTLAKDFATQINTLPAFKQAGVSASAPTTSGSALALTYQSGDSISWSTSTKAAGVSAGEKITFSPTANGTTIDFSGTVEKSDVVTITGTLSQNGGSTPPAVTPGHKVINEPSKK